MKGASNKEYAIVDIETTGGHAAASGITEIAIVVTDGTRQLQRYETLINPQRFIPHHIEVLTGISNEMVEDAPLFEEVAADIYGLLKERVFVAHNVNFDYSFVQYALENAGYQWSVPKLCTVRLSRKIRPGLPSYSLGRLCQSLEIPLENRHRAGGDADATAILFEQLLQWDTEGHISRILKKDTKEQILPPQLPREEFDQLPSCPGVYYFLDAKMKPIYVGKAIQLSKRVAQHFTGTNFGSRRQNFLREIYHIAYEICATELMALLLEAEEIRRLWPRYNLSLKHFEPKFGLIDYTDQKGFHRMVAGRIGRNQICLQTFPSEEEARNLLHQLVRDFNLCPEKCQVGSCDESSACPVCSGMDDCQSYNLRVKDAIAHLSDYTTSYLVVDKGRKPGEKSCIWVQHGNFKGMGYLDETFPVDNVDAVTERLQPYTGFHYVNELVSHYAREHPFKVTRI